MRIKSKSIELLYNGAKLTLTFEKGENRAVGRLFEEIGTIDPNKDYEVSIRPKKRKRSLDANAYFWVLVGKLGEKRKQPDSEVYRELVRDNGVFQIVPIKQEALKDWERRWSHNGIGWICEDLGECRNTPGYHNMKCYFGSSTYTTQEMSRLIDAVIWECKEQGIETKTPNEIEEMKQKWGVE